LPWALQRLQRCADSVTDWRSHVSANTFAKRGAHCLTDCIAHGNALCAAHGVPDEHSNSGTDSVANRCAIDCTQWGSHRPTLGRPYGNTNSGTQCVANSFAECGPHGISDVCSDGWANCFADCRTHHITHGGTNSNAHVDTHCSTYIISNVSWIQCPRRHQLHALLYSRIWMHRPNSIEMPAIVRSLHFFADRSAKCSTVCLAD